MASSGSSDEGKIAAIKKRLSALETERAGLEVELAAIVASRDANPPSETPLSEPGKLTVKSPPAEKIALFRSLFRGREDVFPKRWTNSRSGKSGYAHGHDLGQVGDHTFFVIFIHRQTNKPLYL